MSQDLMTILKAPAELIKYMPIRCLFKKEDGQLYGLCENSFSMSWEKDRALIMWSGKAYSNLGTTHQLTAIDDAEYQRKSYATKDPDGEYIIIDPLSEDSPIDIDWERWLAATSKYDSRNARFKLKEVAYE